MKVGILLNRLALVFELQAIFSCGKKKKGLLSSKDTLQINIQKTSKNGAEYSIRYFSSIYPGFSFPNLHVGCF